jgi:hypothetical protein
LQFRKSARDDFADCADARGDVLIIKREIDEKAFIGARAARTRFGKQQSGEALTDFTQTENFDEFGATPEASGNEFQRGERDLWML